MLEEKDPDLNWEEDVIITDSMADHWRNVAKDDEAGLIFMH